MNRVEPPLTPEDRERLRPTLVSLLEARLDQAGEPLLRSLNRQTDELNSLLETDLTLLDEIWRYRSFILEQTVWVRDENALDSGLGRRIVEQAEIFFSRSGWRATMDIARLQIGERPWILALGFGPLAILLLLRRRIAVRIRLAGDRVARASTDRFRESLLVAGFATADGVAMAAPFFALSMAIGDDPLGARIVIALDRTLGSLATFVFAVAVMASVMRRGGLAERHFHWKPPTIRTARRFVWFAAVAVAFAFGDRMCDPRELDLPDLGRLLYTPIPLLIAAFFVVTIRSHDDRKLIDQAAGGTPFARSGLARAVFGLCVAVPIIAAIAANIGWYQAVSMLQRATMSTLIFVALLLVLREVLFRGLHARQRSQSWQLRRQRDEGEDVSDEVEHLEEIGVRTRGAIRFCMVTLVLLGIWAIWSNLLPAFQGFRGVEVWTYEAMVPNEETGVSEPQILAVTLGAVAMALASLLATFYASRHLPTLFEIVVLDRIGLERGVRYAAVQLMQWVVVIGGLAYSFSLIGITWSSVQWLAAGFTVGLGFGLQEIFANFISGLIILFEQPVRVGDVVTVGGTTGRISRVRMRSTTITDWDRKELVVPNKQFITQEVVNWSIGDSCIRLVLPVGVGYGEDPDRISELLMEIGGADPGTLADPEPHVFFAGFGDSALLFELRVYLPDTDGLVPVRNRLNTAIKKAFDAAGVDIPFPQRTVHVSMVSRDDPDATSGAPIPVPPIDREGPSEGPS